MKLEDGSCLFRFMANRHSRVCVEKTLQSNGNLRLLQNNNVLTPKGEFKLAPNPARLGAGRGDDGARACVVNQA